MPKENISNIIQPSLRTKLKFYKKRAIEIEKYLTKQPDEWGKFQSEFNSAVNGIFRDIMEFEKQCYSDSQEEKIYKLKRIFINRIRDIFLKGEFTEWSYRKPYGYAGDFKIIDDIYLNHPSTAGYNRLFDNYYMMSAIAVAVRNRKEDFKRLLHKCISEQGKHRLRVMDLASGPCREIQETLSQNTTLCENVVFDCYEHDEKAIDYASHLLDSFPNVHFIKENAMRIAFRKDVHQLIREKYDFIYSTGLFDYFNARVATAVIRNLKKLLNPGGTLAIATMRDKYSNPSVHYMEWVGDWNLVYRDETEFQRIFVDAGFSNHQLIIRHEQQGIMQYIIASNS
jgi:extracellular factor (EF) 3-hydroxypalmitic acid methyl ester biosynthesis protein